MIRDAIATAFFALSMLGIWQIGAVQRSLSGIGDSPIRRKMAAADRVVHYRFDEHESPAFHLDGDERELRLVTHLVLSPGRDYLPRATYDYGLRLRIEDPHGAVMWSREIHTSTRQSKADRNADGTWAKENAFSLEPGVQITDDRVHLVTLPPGVVQPGYRFSLELDASAASYGLMRAYERSNDDSLASSRLRLGLAREEEQRLVGRLTYLPWDALTEDQRRDRLRLRWNRLSALGELGTDYRVETIFYSGFRAPPEELPPPPPTVLEGDRATALTAWGPGMLRVSVHADCSDLDDAAPEPSVGVQHLDAMGVAGAIRLDPCGGASVERWLPEGPHTLHLRGHDLPPTVVEAWYDDHRQPPEDTPGFELGRPHRPTVTRSPRVRLHAGSVPARYVIVEPEDLESAMLRLRAWLTVPPRSGPSAQRATTVRIHFVDRHGETLERVPWVVEPSSTLEPYEWVEDAADADRRWWIAPARITRLLAPEGTHHVELEATSEVIVSLDSYWAGAQPEPRPAPPYDEAMLVETRWRRIPIEHRRWYRIDPENVHVLQRHGQSVDLHGPIRLELWPEHDPEIDAERILEPIEPAEPPSGTSQWVTLAPVSRHERRVVLERTDPASPWARYARWRPGAATLTVDDDWGATLIYVVDADPAAALGQELAISIDGQPMRTMIVSTRGTWKLPGLSRGRHAVELSALPAGVRVFLDRPQLRPHRGEAEVYGVITIYRLDDRTMQLEVDKRTTDREYVNVVPYRCDADEASALQVVLDEGSPRRRRGVAIDRVTAAERRRTLPAGGAAAELVFFDRRQARCASLGRVPIPLGPDLAGGGHRIALRIEEGPGVWVRFFRRGTAEPEKARAVQWTERLLDLDGTGGTP